MQSVASNLNVNTGTAGALVRNRRMPFNDAKLNNLIQQSLLLESLCFPAFAGEGARAPSSKQPLQLVNPLDAKQRST
jgi:hypothetical protein